MKPICFVATLTAALTLGGCAELSAISDSLFVTPKTPKRAVFEVEGDYLAAKTLAAKYIAEPACGTTAAAPVPLCSSPAMVTTIGTTEGNVEQVLAAAENTVNDPNFVWAKGAALPDTVIAAENAVGAFASIVHSTGVK